MFHYSSKNDFLFLLIIWCTVKLAKRAKALSERTDIPIVRRFWIKVWCLSRLCGRSCLIWVVPDTPLKTQHNIGLCEVQPDEAHERRRRENHVMDLWSVHYWRTDWVGRFVGMICWTNSDKFDPNQELRRHQGAPNEDISLADPWSIMFWCVVVGSGDCISRCTHLLLLSLVFGFVI